MLIPQGEEYYLRHKDRIFFHIISLKGPFTPVRGVKAKQYIMYSVL